MHNAELGHEAAKWRRRLWCAAVVAGLLQSWAYRHVVSPDGISYLDIGQACARNEWHSLVNGYWSPLYPFLFGLAFRLLRPSPYWESTVAHLVNFGIFIVSFVCFEAFLRMLIRVQRQREHAAAECSPIPEWAMWALGDSVFVCFTLLFVNLGETQPDICVVALVFLAAAVLLRIRLGDASWITYGIFGVVLGVGYLAKAAMFPLAFIFLGCAVFAAKPLGRAIPKAALALAAFLLVGGPFIWGLSQAKGRITFGDSGKINYAEFVNGVAQTIHWQGGPAGSGRPLHPTRMLLVKPPLYEFATPINGTFPPWYDPSYWYEGVVPQFKLRNQLRAVRYTIEEYVGIFPYMAGVFVSFLGMALFARMHGSLWKGLVEQWPLWVPALSALGLYALVYVEARYVASFLVLICMSLFAGLSFPRTQTAQVFVRCVTLATVLMLSMGIAWIAGRTLFRALAPQPFVDWEVAEDLHEMGMRPGDHVAYIGDGLYAYWAHLGGVRIVAQILLGAAPQFWASPPAIQSEVLADFAKSGATLVVAGQGPPRGSEDGWQRIGHTDYFVHDLGDGVVGNGARQ
jgi:hypothetical protein